MVFHIKNSSTLKEFFLNMSLNNDTASRICEKMGTVQTYLKTNTEISNEKKNQTAKPDQIPVHIQKQLSVLHVNVDKIGAQIIQDVLAGVMINHVHVFQPANAAKLGLPPQHMMKMNETQEF